MHSVRNNVRQSYEELIGKDMEVISSTNSGGFREHGV
jgi:hypothetical protein